MTFSQKFTDVSNFDFQVDDEIDLDIDLDDRFIFHSDEPVLSVDATADLLPFGGGGAMTGDAGEFSSITVSAASAAGTYAGAGGTVAASGSGFSSVSISAVSAVGEGGSYSSVSADAHGDAISIDVFADVGPQSLYAADPMVDGIDFTEIDVVVPTSWDLI